MIIFGIILLGLGIYIFSVGLTANANAELIAKVFLQFGIVRPGAYLILFGLAFGIIGGVILAKGVKKRNNEKKDRELYEKNAKADESSNIKIQ